VNKKVGIAIDENLNLERDAGYVMPKKKRSWKHTLSKLFTSCFNAKNDAD